MTIGIIDGFEEYPGLYTGGIGMYSTWSDAGGETIDSALVAGRVGGQALRIAYNRRVYRVVNETDEFANFFAWRHEDIGWVNALPFATIAGWNNGTTNHLRLVCTESRDLQLLDSAGNVLAVVLEAFQRNVWYSISVTAKIHDSLGSFTLRLNGELIMNLSNIDTRNGATTTVNRVYFGPNTNGGVSNMHTNYDDFRWDYDTLTYIKEGRGVQLVPTSDVAVDFAPLSGGSNYLMVDELTGDGDTTYVTSNTVTDEDRYGFDSLPVNPDEIFAVMISVCARKDDVATRRLKPFLDSNGDRVDFDDIYLSTDYQWTRFIQELDPDGAIPWTKAKVDALEGGFVLVE